MRELTLPLLVLASLARPACAQRRPAAPAARSSTGTYAVNWRRDAGCSLKAQDLSGSRIPFQLECRRGAPTHNRGEAEGSIPITDGKAVYAVTEWGGRCEIRFDFQPTAVVVTQVGSDADCGFGAGVYSSGTYRLLTRRPPGFRELP